MLLQLLANQEQAAHTLPPAPTRSDLNGFICPRKKKKMGEFLGRSIAYWLPISFFIFFILTTASIEHSVYGKQTFPVTGFFTNHYKKIYSGISAGSADCSFPTCEGSSHLKAVAHGEGTTNEAVCRQQLGPRPHLVSGHSCSQSVLFATTNINPRFHVQSPCLSFSCFSGS